MILGLLWYDSDCKKSLATKISEAIVAYEHKMGVYPEICWVNADQGKDFGSSCIPEIVPTKSIQNNHVLVGMKDKNVP